MQLVTSESERHLEHLECIINLTSRARELRSAPSEPDDLKEIEGALKKEIRNTSRIAAALSDAAPSSWNRARCCYPYRSRRLESVSTCALNSGRDSHAYRT